MTLAIHSVEMPSTAKIGLDNRTKIWYNMRMTTETSPISDSLPRFNLEKHPVNHGFTMTFPNRITVSIRWGTGNYSDGKTTAECAAWNADNHVWIHVNEFDYHGEDVLAHMETHEVARFIYNASQMTA